MTYSSTPLVDVNSEVFSLVETLARTVEPKITVYPEFPNSSGGITTMYVVMQLVNTPIPPMDFQRVISSTERGASLQQIIQFDCYHDDATVCRTLTEAVFYGIWEASDTLRAKGIRVVPGAGPADRPEFTIGSRLYKMSFNFGFQITMSKAL